MTVSVHCPHCHSDEIYRHGLSPTKRERMSQAFGTALSDGDLQPLGCFVLEENR
ncbi:hypothetical protein CE195_08430 [Sodalis-like symbiont of Philaenus spumarius]|nr:hypothetical protein CE195_08430 [Sodalis-like symbiont of Philaenus spumarius]